jgi:hypothetical protein
VSLAPVISVKRRFFVSPVPVIFPLRHIIPPPPVMAVCREPIRRLSHWSKNYSATLRICFSSGSERGGDRKKSVPVNLLVSIKRYVCRQQRFFLSL